MGNIIRFLQKITGIHRIHHYLESYGYKIPFTNYGYFDNYGIKKIKNNSYHNCTISGIY